MVRTRLLVTLFVISMSPAYSQQSDSDSDFTREYRARMVLYLFGTSKQTRGIAESSERIHYNWETGNKFPEDPVQWAMAIPVCLTQKGSCSTLNFDPRFGNKLPLKNDKESLLGLDVEKCRRIGFIDPIKDCKSTHGIGEATLGSPFDVAPQASRAGETHEQRVAKARAVAERAALANCSDILKTIRAGGAGDRLKRSCPSN